LPMEPPERHTDQGHQQCEPDTLCHIQAPNFRQEPVRNPCLLFQYPSLAASLDESRTADCELRHKIAALLFDVVDTMECETAHSPTSRPVA
jgi:hypothetical protein